MLSQLLNGLKFKLSSILLNLASIYFLSAGFSIQNINCSAKKSDLTPENAKKLFLYSDNTLLQNKELLVENMRQTNPDQLVDAAQKALSAVPTAASELLVAAVDANDLGLAEYALNFKNVDVNYRPRDSDGLVSDNNFATPLIRAVKGGNFAMVELLIYNNANPKIAHNNPPDSVMKSSPLDYAIENENVEIATLLIRSGGTPIKYSSTPSFNTSAKQQIFKKLQELKAQPKKIVTKGKFKEIPWKDWEDTSAEACASAKATAPKSILKRDKSKTSPLQASAAAGSAATASAAASGSGEEAPEKIAQTAKGDPLDRQVTNPVTNEPAVIRDLIGKETGFNSKADVSKAGFVIDEANMIKFYPGELVIVIRPGSQPPIWGMVIGKVEKSQRYKIKINGTEEQIAPDHLGKYVEPAKRKD